MLADNNADSEALRLAAALRLVEAEMLGLPDVCELLEDVDVATALSDGAAELVGFNDAADDTDAPLLRPLDAETLVEALDESLARALVDSAGDDVARAESLGESEVSDEALQGLLAWALTDPRGDALERLDCDADAVSEELADKESELRLLAVTDDDAVALNDGRDALAVAEAAPLALPTDGDAERDTWEALAPPDALAEPLDDGGGVRDSLPRAV